MEILSITLLFLLVALSREFRIRKDAYRNLSLTQTIHLPCKEWAENHIACIKGVLGGVHAEHTQAVKHWRTASAVIHLPPDGPITTSLRRWVFCLPTHRNSTRVPSHPGNSRIQMI